MISRNRSAPSAAAMSLERTTSAKRTVACLYSAGVSLSVSGEPQESQNRAPSRGWAPHTRQLRSTATRREYAAVACAEGLSRVQNRSTPGRQLLGIAHGLRGAGRWLPLSGGVHVEVDDPVEVSLGCRGVVVV